VAQHRRKFSLQFKAEAAGFVIETGRPIAEIARELKSGGGTLGNWVNEWEQGNPEAEKALTPVERARVAAMEDEFRWLRLENEFTRQSEPSSQGRDRSRALRVGRCGEVESSGRP
jgi:transposase